MFIVYTEPNKFTKSFSEACKIADDHFQRTNEIVAVEDHPNKVIYFPNDDWTIQQGYCVKIHCFAL